MKFNKITLNDKTKPFVFLVIISVAAFGLTSPMIDAAHPAGKDSVTTDISADSTKLFLRSITNTNPQLDGNGDFIAETSIDTSTAGLGFITVSVTDLDASLDPFSADVVLSSVISSSSGAPGTEVELIETGVEVRTLCMTRD